MGANWREPSGRRANGRLAAEVLACLQEAAPVADEPGLAARRMRGVPDERPDRGAVLTRFVDGCPAATRNYRGNCSGPTRILIRARVGAGAGRGVRRMRFAVCVPLLPALRAAPGARLPAERREPRTATWLLTASAVVPAAAATTSLALPALTGLIRIPLLAHPGHWSLRVVQRDEPAELSVAVIAGVVLATVSPVAARMLWRRIRALAGAALDSACMPAPDGLVVVDDPAPEAFALPGLPGRVIVSTGTLHALDTGEHGILPAHERAHLAGHHDNFVAVARFGAAANPLLRPLATSVTYTIDRWADERAAGATGGDRRRVARTVGKAALATHRVPVRSRVPAAALGMLGTLRRLSPTPAIGTAVVLTAALWSAAEAAHDLHLLLKVADA